MEVAAYQDNTAAWVLGQVASVKCTSSIPASTACDGDVVSQTTYDPVTAQPLKTYAFGKLKQTLAYNVDGTIKTVTDGNGKMTTLSAWKRGIPGKVTYPPTTDQPTAVYQQAVINDDGTIASVRDENGFVTAYDYDPMGRLTLIDYPDGDAVNWTSTSRDFSFKSGLYGLPSHWRLWEHTGAGYKVTRYDALWRPVVEESYDNTSPAIAAATKSIVVKHYDAAGRLAFQSYPMRDLDDWSSTTLKGTRYTYDALDRPLTVTQDSELGPLTTRWDYLSSADGPYTKLTNPRGRVTRISYQAFDQPNYDTPVRINQGLAVTTIARDPFGKPTAITRASADGTVQATRTYVYNTRQELCRQEEPETGLTLFGYDGAGNLAWSAAGLPPMNCDPEGDHSAVVPRRVDRTYDARNRLKTLSFPDGRGNTTSTWTPDGLLASIAASDGAGNLVTNTYAYNRRRLPTSERMQWGSIDWTIGHGYDASGHRASLAYPGGLEIAFVPDPLGRPTQAGPHATGVTYHPNGAIAGFKYGNGIGHAMIQNARGLPERSRDAYEGSGTHVFALDDSYDYDENGNVLAISDGLSGARGNRDMVYDDLDRLTKVTSPMFGTTGAPTSAYYAYDALDNLTRVKIPTPNLGRDDYYCYNAKGQLAFVRQGAVCTGSTPSAARLALEYDAQGNVEARDNVDFDFDFGNRLRSVSGSPGSTYVYDGHGRRVRDNVGGSKYSFYSQAGELLFVNDLRTGKQVSNVYLGGSLVAEVERDTAAGTTLSRYLHTDALGSVVARSSSGRSSIVRNEYEPYGALINRVNYDRPGYTGHVMDAATGLIYMQQRYYDPEIGRFLSVDPVTVYSGGDMRHFNLYTYAYNSPYKFNDPDGRDGSPFSLAQADSKNRELEASNPDEARAAQYKGYLVASGLLLGPSAFVAARGLWMANPVGANSLASAIVEIGAGDALGGAALAAPLIPLTRAAFGHTFMNHGQDATNFIMRRAAGSGKPIGQFLDDQAAARLIQENLSNLKNGAISVPIPEGFPARIVMPDGSFAPASTVRIVPRGVGVKTAYPDL